MATTGKPRGPGTRPGSRSAQDEAEELRVGWRMGALGMQVTGEVLAGILLGWLWDRWQGTNVGVVVGAVVGIGVAMWTLIKGALRLNRELDAKVPVKGRGKPIVSPPAPEGDSADKERSWSDEWRDDLQGNGNDPRHNPRNDDDDRPAAKD